ncbi:hypothetical protein GF385_02490 [Candidatus Dependentiae bacterium]|nr:hypothetical protein [Candidatus Dependentiae bacterium]
MGFKFFLKLLVLNFLILNVFAKQNYQEIFLQANDFYRQGEFQTAYNLYKKIKNPSMEVNYNLGNCAYKLNDFGYAMLYWKRAEKDWGFFNRTELLENINILRQKLFGKESPKSKLFEYLSFYKNYFLSLVRSAPLFSMQILFLIFWIISFLYIRFLFKRNKRFLIYILFVFIATLGVLLVLRYNLDFKNYGIVVSKNAEILSGPGDSFQKLGVLPETSQVRIQRISDDYYKIKFQRLTGWINQEDVEKI